MRKKNPPFWMPQDILDLIGGKKSADFAYLKHVIII